MSVTLIVTVTLIQRFRCTWLQWIAMFRSENAGRQINDLPSYWLQHCWGRPSWHRPSFVRRKTKWGEIS